MRHVSGVNALFKTWMASLKPANPSYGLLTDMAAFTPSINASEWKHALDDCLPLPMQEAEDVYMLDTRGLILTDKLVERFRSTPSVAVHWITMVVHAYLFSASSYKFQEMSGPTSSKCVSYLKTIAPFALQVLYAAWHVSTDQLEVTRHIHRMFLNASKSMFTWMPPVVRHHAVERLRSIKLILGVPDDFYSPLAMDKRYSYLPVFKVPVISSILNAFETKANYDIFNFQMARTARHSSSAVVKNRWRLQHTREIARMEDIFIGANAAFLPLYMLVFIPPVLHTDPLLSLTDIVTSYAGIGRIVSHELMHAFDR